MDVICEQFVATGKCSETIFCINRHPKEWKFWLEDPRGCLRGQMCMYLHKVENKGKNMKASKAKSERDEDSKKGKNRAV